MANSKESLSVHVGVQGKRELGGEGWAENLVWATGCSKLWRKDMSGGQDYLKSGKLVL